MKQFKINTYLPLFYGFYGSIYDEPYIEEDLNSDNLDWINYFNEISESLCVGVEENLIEILQEDLNIQFKKIHSPMFYNFTNDRILCEVSISEEALSKIEKYLILNYDCFEDYLSERFTSRSGFISFYPNDGMSWLRLLRADLESDENIMNVILDFLLINEDIRESDLEIYCAGIFIDELYFQNINENK